MLKTCITVSTNILSSTTLFKNKKCYGTWAANLHIKMISEGPCDTEDWSNDAENSALISPL